MQLYYKKLGTGAPLIILHGLYGNSDNWISVSRKLSEQYTVYVPDTRNHGRSPHDTVHTFEAMQEDLLEFMQSQKIEKASIVGHSMGGKTAMLYALLHPEKVEKLVIVDVAPKSYKSLLEFNPQIIEHLNILNAYASVDISQMKSRAEIDAAFAQYIPNLNLRQFLLKNADRDAFGKFFWTINVKTLQKALPAIMDWPKLDEGLQAEMPCLFIKGEKSNYIEDRDLPEIKKMFPKAELTTIFDAGHWVHAEQQEFFINSLQNFLNT